SIDGAAVLDNTVAVELRNIETDTEARLFVRLGKLRSPHLFESGRLQNATVRPLALVEKNAEKAAKIKDGGIHAAGRGHAELKLGRLELKPVVRPHIGFREACDQLRFGLERAVAKPHRLKHGMPQIACEGLTAVLLKDISDGGKSCVGILGVRFGRIDQYGVVQAVNHCG